ncbi:MAG: glutamyl-tRNA reductase [Arsenophonus sp.]|nr:MAG: glutamyl-tRNA reductase [Arsenophonus sp.]
MTLLALGINHKTAPINLRERLIIRAENIEHVLDNLLHQSFVLSGVVLSTCNRTEIYSFVNLNDILYDKLINWFCSYHSLNINDVRRSIYCYQDNAVVNHLMRVASGLDSLAFGESQILGQVKQAFLKSQNYKKLSSELERLFQHSFFVAKRIRTETEIGSNSVSIAFVVCRLVRQVFKSLSKLNIFLIGAGKNIELTARHLLEYHPQHLIIANRTPERALRIAKIINAEFIHLNELNVRLSEADIVISSTASPVPIINEVMIKHAMKVRNNKFMLLIDIAVPRDIEQNVKKINNIYLYSIDYLEFIIQENTKNRKVAALQAERIIKKESANFMKWLCSQSSINIIRNYRKQSEKMRILMVGKALASLQNGTNSELVINKLTYQLMNRLIHAPIKSLKKAVLDDDINRFNILKDSLGLKQN